MTSPLDQLIQKISHDLDIKYDFGNLKSGDYRIAWLLREHAKNADEEFSINDYIKAGWTIGGSARQTSSIDEIIDAHQNEKVSFMGKLGISSVILKHEQSSQCFKCQPGQRIDTALFNKSWLGQLRQLLTAGINRNSFDQIFDNLQIVNFNYDRCIEQYLPDALSQFYDLPLEHVKEVIDKRLRIYRPYGSVGRLPWQSIADAEKIPFGDYEQADFIASSSQIRTYTEQVSDKNIVHGIRDAIGSSENIVFLGFAFHRQNLELLAPGYPITARIFGTVYGVSEPNRASMQRSLVRTLFQGHDADIHLAALEAGKFLDQYSLPITSD